jgi:hypothetical protein
VSPEGALMVRNSESDALDPMRRTFNVMWDTWVKEVEKRKATAGTGTGGEFDKKDPKK